MKLIWLVTALILLAILCTMAYASRQALIPGFGEANELLTRQALIPGGVMLNDTQSAAAATRRIFLVQ